MLKKYKTFIQIFKISKLQINLPKGMVGLNGIPDKHNLRIYLSLAKKINSINKSIVSFL